MFHDNRYCLRRWKFQNRWFQLDEKKHHSNKTSAVTFEYKSVNFSVNSFSQHFTLNVTPKYTTVCNTVIRRPVKLYTNSCHYSAGYGGAAWLFMGIYHLGWLSKVLHPTQPKTGHFGDVPPSQSLGLVWKKLNLTQQKHAFTNQKKCTTTQNNQKKLLKPGLVASFDIRPGNGEGLFLFRRFINTSLTYLLRCSPTYL